MSPEAVAAQYAKHSLYEREARQCLRRGRSVEECSISNVTGTPSIHPPRLNSSGAMSSTQNVSGCCHNMTAACLACRAMQSVEEYCHDNDAVDAPIPGCSAADEVGKNDLDLQLADPGLEKLERQALEAGQKLVGAHDDSKALQVKSKDISDRTLVATVQIGGMDCSDAVSPTTERAVSNAFSIVLQMSAEKIKCILKCRDDELKGGVPKSRPNGVSEWPLPVEERSIEIELHVVCVSPASALLKRPMLQHLNGGRGLLSITTKLVAGLKKGNVCPIEGGCSKVVVESVAPDSKKQGDSGSAHFTSVFGYTLSDLMRLTGRPPPARMTGPPGMEIHEGDDTDGWLLSTNKRLTFIRAFTDEYKLQKLLADSAKWLETQRKGFKEKFDETRRSYEAALKLYKSSSNYVNPVRAASEPGKIQETLGNEENSTQKQGKSMAQIMKDRSDKAGDELIRLTKEFGTLEKKAENLSQPFEWPTEHTVVEGWLGISTNNSNATEVGPTPEERVKFEESEASRQARADFLAQRKRIWEERMVELKQSALEEAHKSKISKALHDRRVRIASERLEDQQKQWERVKAAERRAYDSRMEKAMEKLENITDTRSANDFVHEIQEKKRLQAEAEQLHKMDNKFESSVKRLREMKRNGSNATAEAKEEAAEEVKEDMMKLEMEVCNP